MKILKRLFNSSIGLKFVMALTGLALIGFVFGHMVGNLQVFLPADEHGQFPINQYAHALKAMPGPLWAVRLGLLALLALHVVSAIRLKRANQAARPHAYMREDTVQASYASRSMMMSGLLLLLYIVYHLGHFTFGAVHSQFYDPVNVRGMVIRSFQSVFISGAYIIAMGLLWLHLSHAISSIFQSLGVTHRAFSRWVEWIAPFVATVIVAGYIVIPLAILVGAVRL